tara:strand:- start:5643 stop:7412 length:1770 start_codon:yes stop_codon:yes gene_type:complete
MKSFLKSVLAVFTALVIFFILTFFFTLGFLALLSPTETVVVNENSILHLNLKNKVLAERSPIDDFAFPMDVPLLGNVGEPPTVGLDDLRKAIRSAAQSDKVSGIFLEAGSMLGGQALHQELRNELLNFKESGKFIISYDTFYSEMGYYVSSTADSVYMHPYGDIAFTGFASQGIYLRGMLDKLEIEPEIFVVGEFKSAVEMYMNYDRSEEDREQTLEFLNDIHQVNLEAIAESRGLEPERVKEISDQFLIRRPEDALELGFVEGIQYKNEVENILRTLVDGNEEEELNLVTLSNFNKSPEIIRESTSRDRIAIIYASGEIGSETVAGIQAGKLVREIEQAKENDRVKAIVLRVDTPGGSVLASEEIRYALALASEEKPLVISMSNVSASGGYWISMPADTLVAQSNTITGSIGIFGMLFNAEGLLENKLGINTDVVTTGQFSDIGNMAREMRPNERAIIQEFIEEGYDRFINVVAEGRNMSEEEVRRIAEGRVYGGLRAKELGLVDVIGGLDRSLEIAAELADLEDYRTIAYPEQKTFIETLFIEMNEGVAMRKLKSELGPLYPVYEQYKTMMRNQGILARMPFDVIVE